MAQYYVRSGAAGANNGTSKADAYTSLVTALSGKAAGDIFWIANDHSESAAGLTFTSPGTLATPCFFFTVNFAGSTPPAAADLTTGSAFLSTGNTAIVFAGTIGQWYGSQFTIGNSTGSPNLSFNNTAGHFQQFKNCAFIAGSTGACTFSNGPAGGAAGGLRTLLEDCDFTFSSTGNRLDVVGDLEWRGNGSAIGGTIPTTLINFVTSRSARVLISGVDLSAAGAGKTLVGATVQSTVDVRFVDCKLNASVTVTATPSGVGYPATDVIRSDSGDTNYRFDRYRYQGTLTVETTIVRSGGAAAPDGTGIAWKVVTTANAEVPYPFECPPIAAWCNDTGSPVALTIEGTWGGGSVPNDNQIWVEVTYLGTNGFPIASRQSDGLATLLSTAAAQAASSEAWGGGTTPFKLSTSFVPEKEGWVYATVCVAKPSDTFYIDPKITLTP